jgi:ubiquinone/menaquinone biosynthesis C-methylase UbiE
MRNWTGERLETFIYSRDAIEHLHRYAIAKGYVKNKVVLDIACGDGYGSNLMSEHALFVHGVDIDDKTVQEARLKYKRPNIEFTTGSTSAIPIKDSSIDVVVSFETIEHHDKHDEMMAEIKRVLKPGGLIIISTPDKLYYSDERNFNNKYHLKELYKREFGDLIANSFKQLQLLSQKYANGNSIIQEEKTQDDLLFFTGNYTAVHQKDIKPLYLIALASDQVFEVQKTTIFDGSSISQSEMIAELRKSDSFRVGHFILWPFKFLKRKLK